MQQQSKKLWVSATQLLATMALYAQVAYQASRDKA